MAIAHTKTWAFNDYFEPYVSVNESIREWWWGMKTVLLAMGWTVEGGYMTTPGLHNNDQFDIFPTKESIDRPASDVWYHLKAPAALGVEITLSATWSSGGGIASMHRVGMKVSHAAGFGAVNGGVDGSSTASPTATDQVVVITEGLSSSSFPTGVMHQMYGAVSADGKSMRFLVFSQRVLTFAFFVDHLANAHANLDNGGRVFGVRNTSTVGDPVNTVMDNDWYTGALVRGRVSGVSRNLYIGTHGYANLGHQSLRAVLADRKMVVAPCDIYNSTAGERGYYGTVPDMYWGNNHHQSVLLGDTLGGTSHWISGGSLITPWATATPRPRVF